MKRLALFLGALGVIGFSVFASGSVEAYQPVEDEIFFADPFVNLPESSFDAVVEGCFPGEQVVFFNTGPDPDESAVDTCDTVTFEARVTFQAPVDEGEYNLYAYLAAEESTNPDIPDRPSRLLQTTYIVDEDIIILDPGDGGIGLGDGAVAFTSTSGSGVVWPSFLSLAGFYRTFLALLALMAGIFFVLLWRRRREEEEQVQSYAGGHMPPPESSTPTLA